MEWTAIPDKVLLDCCQLVKANSIEGNKKNNISIIYTPAANLKKTGDMAIGQVSFHKDKLVRRFHVAERQNEVVNRMNKTKGTSAFTLGTANGNPACLTLVRPNTTFSVERQVDHEGDKIEREKEIHRIRVKEANERKQAEAALLKARKEAAAAKSYDTLFAAQQQEKKERQQAKGSNDEDEEGEAWNSDDDFM